MKENFVQTVEKSNGSPWIAETGGMCVKMSEGARPSFTACPKAALRKALGKGGCTGCAEK